MGLQAKPLKNIVCFIGENSFALCEEQRLWRKRFREKYDDHNLLVLEGAELTVGALLDEVGVSPFLAERRLVFIRGIPRFSREEMETILAHSHPDVILVFVAEAPDRRLGGVKVLLQHATIRQFPPLRGTKLMAWMRSIPAAAGLTIEEDALRALVECIGEDQEILYHELKKLCLFVGTGAIGRRHVWTLTVANSVEGMIWRLLELMGGNDPRKALVYVHELLERGEDPFRLWNALLWMLRSIMQTSMLTAARSTEMLHLREALRYALDADRHLKTGEYRASAAAPGELLALVDQLVLRIAEAMTEKRIPQSGKNA
jgi:DNA polymerase III subunit delta